MKIIIKLFLFCVLWTPLLAQNTEDSESTKNFGIRAGWTQSLISDQHASPLLYEANLLNIGAIYQQQSSSLFEIALTMNIGTNQAQQHGKRTATIKETPNIYGEEESYEIEANPFLSMAAGNLSVKTLWSLNEYHNLGFAFHARHIYTALGADNWHYTQLDIAPEYLFSYRLLQADLQAGFSLPLLAAVVRPNYAYDPSLPDVTNYWWGYVKTASKITSVQDLFNPRAKTGIIWHFENGRDVGVEYFVNWTSYPEPRPVRMFEQGIDLVYFF